VTLLVGYYFYGNGTIFFLYAVFWVIVFLVIIYFKSLLRSKALGFEILKIFVFKTF
jgi:hypothetical protein